MPPWVVVVDLGCIVGVAGMAYFVFVYLPEQHRLITKHSLRELAFLYHNYHHVYRRSPSNLEDLLRYEEQAGSMSGTSLATAMVREGRFILIWDAVLFPDGEENEKYVLGYEADVSQQGGLVMRGGSVYSMSAEAFHRLPKIPTRSDTYPE